MEWYEICCRLAMLDYIGFREGDETRKRLLVLKFYFISIAIITKQGNYKSGWLLWKINNKSKWDYEKVELDY